MKHFLDESAECERCGRMDDLKGRDGLMVCYDCQEELDRAAWIAKHEAPPVGDMAMLYADKQPACLIAAYENGEAEEEMLALLRVHRGVCPLRQHGRDSPDGPDLH